MRLAIHVSMLATLPIALLSAQTRVSDRLPWPPVATFSILAYDSTTGEIGAAVQSRVFSVGNGVLWAEAGVGAAATQAVVDVSYGPQALALLRKGLGAGPSHQGNLVERSRPASARLVEARPSVRGDRRQGQRRRVHRTEGDPVGRTQVMLWSRHALHGARQHSRRARRRR